MKREAGLVPVCLADRDGIFDYIDAGTQARLWPWAIAFACRLSRGARGLMFAVDLIPFDASGELPGWIHFLGIEPFYKRVGAG